MTDDGYYGRSDLPIFDAETYHAARRAWDTGEFGPEWREVRYLSWEMGYPYPPAGDPYDDPDDAHPSQRSILYRALDYRPIETIRFVRESRSWHEVVERIIGSEQRLREAAEARYADAVEEREGRPGHRESVIALKRILDRITDS